MSQRNPRFAQEVIARDKSCQGCSSVMRLQAHHIVPLSMDGADNIDNGIALCAECHANKHPNIPRNLFLIQSEGPRINAQWNRTSLAAHLKCSTRTITRAARRLDITKNGCNWAFTNDEADQIKQSISPRSSDPSEKIGTQTNVRLNDLATNQLEQLNDQYRTNKGSVIAAAIERMWHNEYLLDFDRACDELHIIKMKPQFLVYWRKVQGNYVKQYALGIWETIWRCFVESIESLSKN